MTTTTDTPVFDKPPDPKRRKGDFTPLYLLIPTALKSRLKASAKSHNRRVAYEVITALEEWVKRPWNNDGGENGN